MEGQWQSDLIDENARERCDMLLDAVERDDPEESIGHLFNPPFVVPRMTQCELHTLEPMHLAAMAGDLNALRALFTRYPEQLSTLSGCPRKTPCGYAVLYGRLDAARWLWQHDDTVLQNLVPYIERAAFQGHCPMLQWLLSLRPVTKVRSEISEIWSGLIKCTSVSDRIECALLLSSMSNSIAGIGLCVAAAYSDLPIMRELIGHGVRVLAADYVYMRGALDNVYVIQILFHLSIHHINQPSGVLLADAIITGSPMCVARLLQDGAETCIRNAHDSIQPLWIACTGRGTDHSVDIIHLLLGAGAKPWLYDIRGSRLTDVVQTGYWFIMSLRHESIQHAHFTFQENRHRIAYTLKQHMSHWTPRRHAMFSSAFQKQSFTFLLCNHRLRETGQSWLIRDVLYLIFEWLAVAETFDRAPFEHALGRLKKTHLESIVQTQTAKKTLKRDLIQTALEEQEQEDDRRVRRRIISESLPEIIGRIECRVRNGTVLSYNVPRPNDKPWVNMGRAYVNDPSKGAFADFNLHSVPNNRRVSRLHVSLCFNVIASVWEIRVHGKNGIIFEPDTLLRASEEWIRLPSSLVFQIPFCDLQFQVTSYVPCKN